MTTILPMLDRAFGCVLQASWQAAALAVMVLVSQAAFGRWMSPRGRHALWLLVALRLALPALPSAPWSVFNLARHLDKTPQPVAAVNSKSPTIKVIYGKVPDGVVAAQQDAVMEPVLVTSQPPSIAQSKTISLFNVLSCAWIIVCAGLIIRLIVRGSRFARRVGKFERVTDENLLELLEECAQRMHVSRSIALLWAEGMPGPALTGVFRPKILLPRGITSDLSDNEIRFIFLHELAHLKRRDIVVDWLVALLQTLHWFNPLVWYAMWRRRAERELVCDAFVLSVCGRGQRRRYGGAIVKLIERLGPNHSPPIAVGIVENKSQLTRRITMIAQFRKSSLSRSLLAGVVVVGVALIAMTDARSQESPKPAAPAEVAAPQPDTAPAEEPAHHAKVERTDAAAQAVLDTKLPEINFVAMGLSDVVDFFRDVSNANIFVNWRALESAGVDRNTPVTARLRNVKFSKALDTVLGDAGGGAVKLGYTIDEGVITITTEDDMSKAVVTQVYDVRELLVIPESSSRPSKTGSQSAPPTTQPANLRETMVKGLISLISETVAPESWREAGGTIGSIQELQGQLIVTQTPQNHKEIAQLLEQVHAMRGLQVRIEARFMSIDEAALASLPPDLRRKVGGELQASGGEAGSADSAKTVSLTHEETAKLLSAATSSQASAMLTAPRIVLFSGQHAYVCVTSQHSYTSDYTMTKSANGETRYEPKTTTIEPGMVFDVCATPSADQKFVTLALHPTLTTLTGEDSVPYSGAPGEKLNVQRPKVKVSELNSMASIPDGQTLVLGGLSADGALLGDGSKEAPKPLLLLVNARVIPAAPMSAPPALQSSRVEK